MRFAVQILALAVASVAPSAVAGPFISEFMADNASVARDGDGEFNDWIEIRNPDVTEARLGGYFLTDDATNLTKWTIPTVTLAPESYLVVFASNKNRIDPDGELHANFKLSAGGEYFALVAPDGATVVSEFGPVFPPQFTDQSFGLSESAWVYFDDPTPGGANTGGQRSGPIFGEVTRNPPQPASGPLDITAAIAGSTDPVASVFLHHRLGFGAETQIQMVDDGVGPDAEAGDGIWTATIPASAIEPGEMTRWRFVASDAGGARTREPAFRDPLDSHEYFGTVGDDPDIQTKLGVAHWFIENPSGAERSAGARGALHHRGEFYDNIFFNRHGQSTGGFIKKSFNIDFNKTQRFLWNPDAPRVADIDLLTNWADKSKVRHVLAWEIMRESGVRAHFAHTVRVEQNGEFYSTADFVEDADNNYLKRAGLNEDGALYKVYNNLLNKDAGNRGASGVEKKNRRGEDNSDLQALIDGLDLDGAARVRYLYDNIDIPKCVNMLAANAIIRNVDMHSKNWYIYRDTGKTDEWAMLPWDLDLSGGRTWNTANTYFDNALYTKGVVITGTTIRLVTHLFSDPRIRPMLFRRMRTLADQFLQAPGTPLEQRYYERRLDELSALIDPPSIVPSDARRDFEKWGSWTQGSGASVPHTSADPEVESMAEAIERWKNEYLPGRRDEIYNHQVVGKGGEIPSPQFGDIGAGPGGEPMISFGAIEFSPASGDQDEEYIELVNPNSIAVDVSGWILEGGVDFTFEPGTVIPPGGNLYLCPDVNAFRARAQSPTGGEGNFVQGGYRGHLSSFGETLTLRDATGAENNSVIYDGDPSDVQRHLAVTEIMYHPAGDGRAEFIELMNVSATVTLDLAGVSFDSGIRFDFSNSGITTLAPGERVLVVRDIPAFTAAHGAGLPVAGEFQMGTALSNGGESIKLEDAANGTIKEFDYKDGGSWPDAGDGMGYSLVLINPASNPDPDSGGNWRVSAVPGGNPGGEDALPPPADPVGDADGNGNADIIDYALGHNLGLPPIAPFLSWETYDIGGASQSRLTLRYPVSLAADSATIGFEASTDLEIWEDVASEDVERAAVENLGDGRAIVTVSFNPPIGAGLEHYLRLRVDPIENIGPR